MNIRDLDRVRQNKYAMYWRGGRVWLKASVLKTEVGETPPWVRIPPSPPIL